MTNRPQGLEAFSDAKVQALFEQFFPAAEVHAEIGDRLTQRVLAEVHTIYGQGAERSSLRGLLERWHTWWIQFNQRPLLIAFGAVACVAMALLTVSTLLPSQSTSPLSLVAMVPSGEAIVLAARGDTYHTYRTGEQFSLRANDQVIVRAGAVELEPFPQQITEILPGSQIALSTVTHVDGKPILELNVIDGQVRHRSFGQQLVNGTYIISTGDIRAFAQNNDIQVDALSPARTLVTAFTDSAWVETQGSMYEVKAGRSAEFGGRVMIIRDITPVEEGPGQIALAPTPTQTTFSATPIAPSPIPHDEIVIASTPSPVDSGDQSTGVALGALEAVAVADAGPVLTVGDVAVQESGALVTLLVNGTGAPGSAVQVLIENTPLVTTTVTAAGTWSATAPLLEPGYFAVNVAALDNTGTALMTVAAAELQVLPPATPGIPPTPTQPLVNTQTPPTASATPAAATATPIPLRATQTPTPISFFVAPPTPTATATRPVAASATPTATGTRLVVIAPTSTTTPTPMQTATPTLTATPIATMTTSPTATASATAIATWTPSPTVTATDTPLWPTLTPTRTPTTTPIPSDTPTSTWTPSPTVTATDTPLWPTLTPTRTPSATPTLTTVPTSTSAPTATGTNTPVWPTPTSTATSTPTPIPPIPTTAPTATAANVIVEITPTALPPANNDGEPTAAATNTPMAAPTATPTAAATNTPMAAPTATPTAAATNTPMAAPTATPTAAPTNTPMAAPTATPTAAPTNTPMAAPTAAPVSLEPTPTVAPTEPSIVATTPEGSAALPDAATETPTP